MTSCSSVAWDYSLPTGAALITQGKGWDVFAYDSRDHITRTAHLAQESLH